MTGQNEKAEERIRERTAAWRRDFHAHPELSGEERETARRIRLALNEMGIPYRCPGDYYAVIGEIRGGRPGPVVALRADMDALPLEERTGLPFASETPGVMHACGHDVHMAALLGAALRLQARRETLPGTVRFLFQPREELSPEGGAPLLIRDGYLDGVRAIFGFHQWPDLPLGTVGVHAGAMMAASDRFKITIHGHDAHAAHPDQGIDAIVGATNVLQEIYQIVSRRLNPHAVAAVSVGTIRGSTRYNVVAPEVVLEGTCRTLDQESREKVPACIRRILEGQRVSYNLQSSLEYHRGYPIVRNWTGPEQLVEETVRQVLGPGALRTDIVPELTGEDFAFYLEKVPGAFFWLGSHRAGEPFHGLHSAGMCPDEETVHYGSRLLADLAVRALEELPQDAGPAPEGLQAPSGTV